MAVTIIAEAGVNHNGSVKLAKQLIDAAKNAGADYVKFQTFVPEKLVSKYAKKAEYQEKNEKEAVGESQLDMLKRLSLSYDDFIGLKKYADEKNIGFISTPFDLESIEFLEKLDMDFWKVPSGEITNYPYLKKIARTKRPVVISTGMSTIDDINAALKVLKENGTTDIKVLHCNTMYPTPMIDVNLLAMNDIKEKCNVNIGYSDHTEGIEVPIAAVALGAQIIEKHFTIDKNLPGPDHKASLEPNELKQMIISIRNIEAALGNGKKYVTDSEKSNMTVARKSIVASQNIKKGEIFSEENLTVKRPGNGISPMKWEEVIGQKADRDYMEDEVISMILSKNL